MARQRWRSGTNGCWWAIVPRRKDSIHPLPWLVGYTRKRAWAAWQEHFDWLNHEANKKNWKCVRVFLTVAS